MKGVVLPERRDIEAELLKIAEDPTHPETIRANAADVLIRMAAGETQKSARDIVTSLGYSSVRVRDRTVYTDRQNVHNNEISKSIQAFIRKIATDTDFVPDHFDNVHAEVSALVRETNLTPRERLDCYSALDRISIDTATFTEYNVGIADIFVYVWMQVREHEHHSRELERRMVEELVEMADWCSTGQPWRFVNVLSVYVDDIILISWADQIKANIVARVGVRLRELPDGERKDLIAVGAMENAGVEEAEAYRGFIEESLPELYDELHGEFVGEGHVNEDDFAKWFESGSAPFRDSEPREAQVDA